jgi:hypothetical protein
MDKPEGKQKKEGGSQVKIRFLPLLSKSFKYFQTFKYA